MDREKSETILHLWTDDGTDGVDSLAEYALESLITTWFGGYDEENDMEWAKIVSDAVNAVLAHPRVSASLSEKLPALLEEITKEMRQAIVELYPGGTTDYQNLLAGEQTK